MSDHDREATAGPWPVLVATGVGAGYVAVGLLLLGDAAPVGPFPVALAGVVVGTVGAAGWGHRWLDGSPPTPDRSPALRLVLRGALAAEALTYGTIVLAVPWLWVGPRAFPGVPVARPLGAVVGTLALLGSSVTLRGAGVDADRDDTAAVERGLLMTVALGTVFLLVTVGEVHGLLSAGLKPSSDIGSALAFAVGTLHALHVGAGVVALGATVVSGRLTGRSADPAVAVVAPFWHFLVVTWVVYVVVIALTSL